MWVPKEETKAAAMTVCNLLLRYDFRSDMFSGEFPPGPEKLVVIICQDGRRPSHKIRETFI